ncbi:MAG TPA: hypothetical protein VN578_04375 [Candidatus Binatia bacterium]|jgi:hypothetical protein|nr:hypothetical protein [Candidatus Binatia bacterium]
MSGALAVTWPAAVVHVALDLWHGFPARITLLVTALVVLIADAAVFLKFFWAPRRQSLELSRRLQAAGISAPVPPLSTVFAAELLTLERKLPSEPEHARSAMLERLRGRAGLRAVTASERGILLHGVQRADARILSLNATNFAEARLDFDDEASGTKLVCRVRFGMATMVTVGFGFVAAIVAGLLLLGWVVPDYRGYLRTLLAAIAGYVLAFLIACWPGQRLLTANFFDTLILESSQLA